MSEVKVVITLLGIVAIVVLVLLVLCHFMGMWTWTVAWIFSSREEKVGLTRAMGHYNANGYLVRTPHTVGCEQEVKKFAIFMEPLVNKIRLETLSCATSVQMPLHGKGKKRGEVMKSFVVWDITPCSALKFNPCFGKECRLHLQGRRIS
jgi:hypothetical protein